MEHDQRTSALGKIGEGIVMNYLIDKGLKPKVSTDYWDPIKDIMLYDKNNNFLGNVEVKSHVPFVIYRAFTLELNQLKKCQEADYFLIIQIPCSALNESAIWQIHKGFKYYKKFIIKDQVHRWLIPMDQEKVTKVAPISKEDQINLIKFRKDYNGKN